MTITKERLAEIKARCDAATPGPWTSDLDEGSLRDAGGHILGYVRSDQDREFLAQVRQDVPDLVTEIEQLRTLVKSAIHSRDCLWCGAPYVDESKRHAIHGDRCPAFTPNGEVK